ncbi:DNA topology modulation protein FlaR [Paenibacillus rhizovicinus]|uniref:DNA topology modulation protein FlaR n=1 Tax=Paenibacillus rhizovicinus TaxID=2704463 RepID=A0A6C0P4N7_9BACL|nr:DNA topology modulation protein FlaR [Paenibacillus rhizovicinus]QHW33415.1 DNA topology modulation protein FlaR [Paenibacillus rhizovicinus]
MIAIKIHIIGGSGSGKSYIAALLSQKLHITHYDLDDIFWDHRSNEYGVQAPEDERNRQLGEIISLDAWITEGVYRSWVEPIFAAADKIVVLMTPLPVQEERIWKRYEERIAGAVPSKKREKLEGIHNLLAWNKSYNLTKLPHLIRNWAYTDKMITVSDNLDILELLPASSSYGE